MVHTYHASKSCGCEKCERAKQILEPHSCFTDPRVVELREAAKLAQYALSDPDACSADRERARVALRTALARMEEG